jgi:hypothetical protein
MKPYSARTGTGDEEWMKWPPRSLVLTPRDFFLWGYVKEQVSGPPLPLDIDELKLTITTAMETVDRNMLESI